MSVTRVNVIENDLTSATFLKIIKQMAVPHFKAAKKDGLNSLSIIQTDNKTIIITNWVNKTMMNKFAKEMALRVAKARAETGGQAWIHSGQVKASG